MPTLDDFYFMADKAEKLPEWQGETPDKLFMFMLLAYILFDCVEDHSARIQIFSQRFKMSFTAVDQVFKLTQKTRDKADQMLKTYSQILQN